MSTKPNRIDEIAFNDLIEILEESKWLKCSQNALVEIWNLCDKRDQQLLMKELFHRFVYVENQRLKKISNDIVLKIEEWGFLSSNTMIGAVADRDRVDGSVAGLQFLKNKFPNRDLWKEDNFVSRITEFAYKVQYGQNLILFDDFIGSGKTFVKKLEYLFSVLVKRGVEINTCKVVAFSGMEFGIKYINTKFDNEVFCPLTLKKGITDYNSAQNATLKRQIMRDLEAKLSPNYHGLKLSEYELGFMQSETLFQIDGYNCPNNVFPVLWWPMLRNSQMRNTIFQRIR